MTIDISQNILYNDFKLVQIPILYIVFIGVGKDCLVRPDPAYVAKFGRKLEKEQKRAASPYGKKGPQGAKKGRNKWQREGAKRTK